MDYVRRNLLAPNHTCTHALNFALRETVSKKTDQKGSNVASDKLRFDFNSTKAVSPDQLQKCEAIVNGMIAEALPVKWEVVPLASARSINTLRAVFGETYPDPVRVVSIGEEVQTLVADPTNDNWNKLSVELCGGTHITNMYVGGQGRGRDFTLLNASVVPTVASRCSPPTRARAR